MKLKLKSIIAVGMTLSAGARARDRSFFQASRALSMGDAFTAYDAGYEAVYYNPAGVARREKPQFKYVDLEGVASQSVFSTLKTSFSSVSNFGKITQNVLANQGKVQSMGISFLPQFLIRNFSIGVVTRAYSEAYIDPTTANLDFFAYTDAALYVQFGVALRGGIIKLGVGAKALNRAEINKTYTPDEYAGGSLSFSNQWQEGTGYGADAGVLITAPTNMQPAIGIAVQDIGNTKLLERRLLWTGSNARPGSPPSLKQKVNAGFSITNKHNRGVRSAFSLEVKDILSKSYTWLQRFHAGLELQIGRTFVLRTGVNQGRYWTAGVGLHAGGVGLELASYGEDVGLGTGTRRDDRKWVGRYVLAF